MAACLLSSRDIAGEIVALHGEDAKGSKYLAGMTKHVSKALRAMRKAGEGKSAREANGTFFRSSDKGWSAHADLCQQFSTDCPLTLDEKTR